MKTYCIKSGVALWKSDLLLGLDLADEHPIFRMKTQLLFTPNMVHRFMLSENNDEKKLIFLAVLHASYLVDIQYPACPTPLTVEKHFHHAFALVQWVRYAEYKLAKQVSFPQYIVRKENADLSNIGSWLNSLNELREKINRSELERDKSAALRQREMEIKRELGEANAIGKAFTPKLAKWSLDLCDITLRHEDYNKWMKILCIPLNEAWMINLSDFYEIQAILQENLPILEDNPQAISVMHQVNTLIRECRRGFTEFSLFSNDSSDEVKDFEIMEDGTEVPKTHKINQHLKDVPSDMPKREDYPRDKKGQIKYLLDKAKYDLAHKVENSLPPPPKVINEDSV